MDTPGVSGNQPVFGVQSTHRDRHREKGNREAFERAFSDHSTGEAPEEAVESENTRAERNTALQPSRPVIRRDPQDGEFHVDLFA